MLDHAASPDRRRPLVRPWSRRESCLRFVFTEMPAVRGTHETLREKSARGKSRLEVRVYVGFSYGSQQQAVARTLAQGFGRFGLEAIGTVLPEQKAAQRWSYVSGCICLFISL
jgi:hypothetical protein